MHLLERTPPIVSLLTLLLALIGLIFGQGLIDRFIANKIIFSVADSELILPPNTTITSPDATTVIPDSIAGFSFANESNTNCVRPIFWLTVSGTISTVVITDTKEKKELIQASTKQETRKSQADTVRFESERLAPGSYVSGVIWYKLNPPRQPTQTDLSNENNFKLTRRSGRSGEIFADVVAIVSAISGAIAVLSLLPFLARRIASRRSLSAEFKGSTSGHNFVGPSQELRAGGSADWQISLHGLDPTKSIDSIGVESSAGGSWRSYPDMPGMKVCWLLAYCSSEKFLKNSHTPKLTNINGQVHEGLTDVELFMEPFNPADVPLTEIRFTVIISYAQGYCVTCTTHPDEWEIIGPD